MAKSYSIFHNLSADKILEDLRKAPENDVVFTSNPPGGYVKAAKGKGGLEKEVERVAADSVKLVSAHKKLKDHHQSELPQTIEQIKQHIADLEDVST